MTADVSIRNRNKAIGDQGANRRAEGVRAAVEEPHPADGDETERWLWEPEPIAYGASVLLGFGASSVRGWVLIKTFIPPAEPFCERPPIPSTRKRSVPSSSQWVISGSGPNWSGSATATSSSSHSSSAWRSLGRAMRQSEARKLCLPWRGALLSYSGPVRRHLL